MEEAGGQGQRGLEAGSRDPSWELGFRGRGLAKTRLDLIKLFPLSLRLLSFALFPLPADLSFLASF